jgi:hypothetical protein
MEHVIYMFIFAIPLAGATFVGKASWSLWCLPLDSSSKHIWAGVEGTAVGFHRWRRRGDGRRRYSYTLVFEALNCLGHCNVELVPPWLYSIFPPLKYLLYSSSFHSLHHSKVSIER